MSNIESSVYSHIVSTLLHTEVGEEIYRGRKRLLPRTIFEQALTQSRTELELKEPINLGDLETVAGIWTSKDPANTGSRIKIDKAILLATISMRRLGKSSV